MQFDRSYPTAIRSVGEFRDAHFTSAVSLPKDMSQEGFAPIAEAKDHGEPPRAPIRLMTQFLKAVSESRMEDALALAQTILSFEPHNAIILDYQATLAQYINNERELAAEDAVDTDEDGDEGSDDGDGSSGEELPSGSTGSEDVSTEEASDDDMPEGGQATATAGCPDIDTRGRAQQTLRRQDSVNVEQETQRLGGLLRELRETRAAESEDAASRWDETKFAATRREVEEVLWKFLPVEAKQAAQKRAGEESSYHQQDQHQHRADHK